ncbi:MAG: peptidylprolyl isomerase [Pseudomonadota bacterium]
MSGKVVGRRRAVAEGRKLICTLALVFSAATNAAVAQEVTHAKIQTSMGDVIVELAPDAAPITVANFLEYATSGHYDRTLIHRVVKDYVIQGGGYSTLYTERVLRDPIPYEGDKGLKNLRGTIAMARGDRPDSAQAQWFINLRDNEELDHRVTDLGPIYGYAVFGRVVDGMDVADSIGNVKTGPGGPFGAEAPLEKIFITRIDPVEWPEVE